MNAIRDALLGELAKMAPGRRKAVAIGTLIVAIAFAVFAVFALIAPTLHGGDPSSGLFGAAVLAVGSGWFGWVAALARRAQDE